MLVRMNALVTGFAKSKQLEQKFVTEMVVGYVMSVDGRLIAATFANAATALHHLGSLGLPFR